MLAVDPIDVWEKALALARASVDHPSDAEAHANPTAPIRSK